MANHQKLALLFATLLVVLTSQTATAQRLQPFGPLIGEEFETDLALFAPGNFESYGGGPDPSVGFFITYDRLHWSATRSNEAPMKFDGDWTYGNRMEFGYMTESDHGWLLEVAHLDPRGDLEGLNQLELTYGEVMKTWRMKPLHKGGILEPMAGFRYTVFKNISPAGFIENNIIAPEVGLRWFKKNGRWTISAEGRYFYGYNMQFYAPTAAFPNGIDQGRWVHAGDLRLEATFSITKKFALSLGWDLLTLSNGIARGDALTNNDQDASFTGATFGFKLNR